MLNEIGAITVPLVLRMRYNLKGSRNIRLPIKKAFIFTILWHQCTSPVKG